MVKEAYVSFEIAKLLKEKGFNVKCLSFFWSDGLVYEYTDIPFLQKNLYDGQLLRPTHQTAMAWLREKGIIIIIDYNEDEDCEENERYGFSIYKNNIRAVDLATYVSYEEAVEAALKYSLETLI